MRLINDVGNYYKLPQGDFGFFPPTSTIAYLLQDSVNRSFVDKLIKEMVDLSQCLYNRGVVLFIGEDSYTTPDRRRDYFSSVSMTAAKLNLSDPWKNGLIYKSDRLGIIEYQEPVEQWFGVLIKDYTELYERAKQLV